MLPYTVIPGLPQTTNFALCIVLEFHVPQFLHFHVLQLDPPNSCRALSGPAFSAPSLQFFWGWTRSEITWVDAVVFLLVNVDSVCKRQAVIVGSVQRLCQSEGFQVHGCFQIGCSLHLSGNSQGMGLDCLHEKETHI